MNLEEYLRFNNIKQHAFAKSLGVSQGHINSMIKGRREPSVALAKKIDKVTNGEVSVVELLDIKIPEEISKIQLTKVKTNEKI